MRTAPDFAQLRAGADCIHIHGHRGARGIWPENTLEGFRFTFDIGVRIVELDILMSADDVPVITHNLRLDGACTRDAGGQWLSGEGPRIRALSLADLQRYDVGGLKPGSEYSNRFPEQAFLYGVRMPTLDALGALLNAPQYADVWLNLEIKSNPHYPEGTPEPSEYVAALLKVIRAHQLQERVILQSFDWRVVHACARQAPAIPRAYLSYAPLSGGDPLEMNIYPDSPWMDGLKLPEQGSLPALIAQAGGQVWAPYHEDLTAEAMAIARDCGLMVNVWTVNEWADIDRMVALGVDGIVTDYPGRVQRRLLAHGLGWTIK